MTSSFERMQLQMLDEQLYQSFKRLYDLQMFQTRTKLRKLHEFEEQIEAQYDLLCVRSEQIMGILSDINAKARALQGDSKCVVCTIRPREVAIIPCGHMCLCSTCAEDERLDDSCPMCRTNISSTQRIYS